MEKVMKTTRIAGNVFSVFSLAALLVMLSVTLVDVTLRFLFNSPITGAVEIVRMMMICLSPTFMIATLENRQIRVGMLIDKLSRKGQIAFDTFGYLLTAVFCGLMSYQAIIDMFRRIRQRQVYTMLLMPTWPFYLLFSISMGLLAITVIVCLMDIYLDKDRYVKHEKHAEEF